MKVKLDSVVSVVLVLCAAITTGLVIRREMLLPQGGSSQELTQQPVFIKDWRAQLGSGLRLGSTTAPVQMIEFADFECPFCRDFYKRLKELRNRYPTQVSLTFMQFPLKGHRFALIAARIAECANEQGRFEAMYEQLFEGQESFGLRPWSDYARAAGVPDLSAFEICNKREGPVPRVETDLRLGGKLDVKGTPTLIVNGWKLGHPPTDDELDAMVKAVLAGKSPLSRDSKS